MLKQGWRIKRENFRECLAEIIITGEWVAGAEDGDKKLVTGNYYPLDS